MLSDPKKQRRMALKYIQNKPNFVREKNNALEAFIYKARRASKKVACNFRRLSRLKFVCGVSLIQPTHRLFFQ